MTYDESLAARIREILDARTEIVEKKMFGGLGVLLRGNMCVGVWKDSLVVRVGADDYEHALAQPHARQFDITGRPMRGWVLVDPPGVDEEAALRDWIERGLSFVEQLPAKGPRSA